MRQYELAIRIAQIHHLVDERKYKKALAVIQTLDVRQVRALSDLKVFAEVYTKTEQYDAAKAMYLRICRSSKTRRVLHRLVYLSIRTNSLEDAEAFYREYMRMNPSVRDALILRYRIDKAAGVPIGRLIEVLQELKQEEYIEEWAYELAKLYHRAGRREECMEECKDIMLWFGSGEIVERAKILMDHLKERDPIPYYDDKDFTMPKKEEPNPYDTGSLPDLNEFIKERKALKREERKTAAKKAENDYQDRGNDTEEASHSRKSDENQKPSKEQQASDTEFIDDYEEDDFEKDMVLPHVAKGGIQKLSGLLKFGRKEEDKAGRKESEREESGWEEQAQNRNVSEQNKIDVRVEKKISEQREEMSGKEIEESRQKKEIPERKKEVSEKTKEISLQEKGEEKQEKEIQEQMEKVSVPEQETIRIKREAPGKRTVEYVPHSQSGTGITQDLAKEITAIYEMEQQGQLKEKAVTVIKEKTEEKESVPEKEQNAVVKPVRKARVAGNAKDKTNIATNLVDRMTQAIQKSASKSYIPIDVEEIRGNEEKRLVLEEPVPSQREQDREEPTLQQEEQDREEPVLRQEEQEEIKDPLTIALEKEVEEYQAAKEREERHVEEKAENEEELLKNLLEEEIADPERLQEPPAEDIASLADESSKTEEVESLQELDELQENAEKTEGFTESEEELEKKEETVEPEEESEEAEETAEPEEESEEAEETTEPEEEPEEAGETAELKEELEETEETAEPEEAGETAELEEELEEAEETAEPEEEPEEAGETAELEEELEEAEETAEPEEEPEEAGEIAELEEESEKIAELKEMGESGESEKVEESLEPQKSEESPAANESTKDLTEAIQAVKKGAAVLQNYRAPEIPVVETNYTEMPQITYEDLPTTRALQQSFQDVLRLIEGELDPSHFVLMGDGTERIVGVSKKIVHVMKASKYLSQGRIAKIRASQLNRMDLISFRRQLKGNCLLIEEASDLLFPTITKIFSIMEEYAGDFVVILSDEGTTLDQLFRFVPVLAKRFKYIIDITKYTEKDYE